MCTAAMNDETQGAIDYLCFEVFLPYLGYNLPQDHLSNH